MKKLTLGLSFFILLLVLSSSLLLVTNATEVYADDKPAFGPTAAEQACMKSCVTIGCKAGDMVCMKKNSATCLVKCNVKKPSLTAETSCMEGCVIKGCEEHDFVCQAKNRDGCEKSCNMIKEPATKSKEEACIRVCVRKVDRKAICRPGEGGEKGSKICQSCAESCKDLYDGPCLGDTKLKAKQKSCETCEHCYGEPIIGDSGEGYKCITDVKCQDASDQFGDDPGTGPGIKKEGVTKWLGGLVINTEKIVNNLVEEISDFLGRLLEKK